MIQCRLSTEELNFLLSRAKEMSTAGKLADIPGDQANGQRDEVEFKDNATPEKHNEEYTLEANPKTAK